MSITWRTQTIMNYKIHLLHMDLVPIDLKRAEQAVSSLPRR